MHAANYEYSTLAERAVITAAEELMEKTMKKYDPSHDAYHVNRVRRTALALAKAQTSQPDLLVIELAALLHDVLDKKYVTPEEAADPYAYFRPFFEGVKANLDLLEDGRAKLIVRIIENVSWTTEKKLRAEGKLEPWHESCVELHCVQDADRLDAIGAFGIMRASAYSAAVNRPLHTPPDDSQVSESAVQHFHDKLLHIKDRLKTPQGRELGAQRHQLMLHFLEAVDKEYDAVIPINV
ncbi:metal-dependent phosphohydrolase, putative [Rhizoctonia solani AG-3 Rhs1AP]|uniref:Metal-dependent phosphohydrolase, putative n=1 Tax=Rhizoctonia solani AG-3 Rhs1AP TaxID=1086054 RepID=X8J7V7_9AGAM|nr:metal-dependent phosphohydrolase, putative [Rhizoctonia solani AG-3 Rhs1AP]